MKDVEGNDTDKPTGGSGRGPKQAGEGPPKRWLEAGVWTPRMLEALEKGVKGGQWFSLWDKVYTPRNLAAAWQQVRANKGAACVDGMTIATFARHAEDQLLRLGEQLRTQRYCPQPIRRVMIPKPASTQKRPLGIPTLRDRIVQTALLNVMEPIFEHNFADHSYGFRPRRGCKDALRRVNQLLENGYHYVVDADIQSYFDSIPHATLMKRIGTHIADGRVMELLEKYLKAQVLDTTKRWSPEQGTPQGAIISPLLANIYLNPLDHLIGNAGYEMIRYADDLVILCKSAEAADKALELLRHWTEENGLMLHPEKTRIANANVRGEGFDFLGYHFECGKRWPRKKSEKKIRETIRLHTRRNNGNSMRTIIEGVNLILRGWFEYFKHSNRSTLKTVDAFTRGRLRSILRKRAKKRGRARGNDLLRWPISLFNNLGLFSLATTRDQLLQSSRR